MPIPPQDWSHFTRRIFIDRPVKQVYLAWAIPANLMQWFLEEASYLTAGKDKRPEDEAVQEGDRYNWRWHNYDLSESGRILEVRNYDRLSFSFGSAGNVHLHFRQKDNGTELELVQDNIPEDEPGKMNYFVDCITGWTFWLTNLKAWLEHGITLHDTGLAQEETKNLINS